ncbi:hypothetical protein PHLCEN_2v11331 [Hermanssonia centrifuga]|uniref:Uncharacterized protein n=1 Tax=Hermanssonia centrifuga TaxID=98765 RepID=A0A2R6NKC1_9APHY|nr:hypothetical protein PHLCEN_2v11331 [Hermanssonia centrifuga]
MSDSIPRIPRRSKKDDDPKMIGLWKIGRTIGKGSSGTWVHFLELKSADSRIKVE